MKTATYSSSKAHRGTVTILRGAESIANLGTKIAWAIHLGEKRSYYLGGSIRIKSRRQALRYLKNRKQRNHFDEKLDVALKDSKNRYFAKFQMKKD